MEIVRAGRSKSPSKKINGFFFSRNRNKLQYTHYDQSRDTPTHAYSRSFKNPPGCLAATDRRENITRRGWYDNRGTRRSTKRRYRRFRVFDDDRYLWSWQPVARIDRTPGNVYIIGAKRGYRNYAPDNAFVLEVCETNGSDFNARYGNTINFTLTARRIVFAGWRQHASTP